MSERAIQITEMDRKRLIDLIVDAQSGGYRGSVYLENLRGELERARVVAPQEIPGDVITMNSTVTLIDQDTGEEETYTLVYPENADAAQGKVSVLAPIGTAMLGVLTRAGDMHRQIKVPGFHCALMEIDVGLLPAVRLRYRTDDASG